MNKGRDLDMMVQEGGSKRDASLTKQSKGQKVRSAIQSNVLGVSIDKDACYGSMGVIKYLRESCYYRIKYSVANSLAALMRK